MSIIFKRKKSKSEIEAENIVHNIDDVLDKIKTAKIKFNTLTDNNLIEASIFEIKSLEARYKYLIEEAKSKNISINAKRTILIPCTVDSDNYIH